MLSFSSHSKATVICFPISDDYIVVILISWDVCFECLKLKVQLEHVLGNMV